jgi:hypothetical protein
MPAQTSCSNIEKVPGAWSFENGQGGPAQVDGPSVVTVLSGDGTFLATGAHAGEFVSGTSEGDTVYELKADANMDPVVADFIVEQVTLTVTAAGAARFSTVTFGAPVPK